MKVLFVRSPPGFVICLLYQVTWGRSANGRKRYICNVFSHCLKPFSRDMRIQIYKMSPDQWIRHKDGPLMRLHPPEDIVDADDTVRTGRPTVVDNRGVTLHPHPTTVLRQEPVVFSRHLTLDQHWKMENSLNLRNCVSNWLELMIGVSI